MRLWEINRTVMIPSHQDILRLMSECLIAPFFLFDSRNEIFEPSAALVIHRWLPLVHRFLKLRVLPQFLEPGFLLLARSLEKRHCPPPGNNRVDILVYTLLKPRIVWRQGSRYVSGHGPMQKRVYYWA